MVTQPLPLAGPSYTSRSPMLAAQTCKNLYPETNKETPKTVVLMPTPGGKPWSAGSATATAQGLFDWNGSLYKVTDNTLYSVSSEGVQAAIGSIAGSARCAFAGNISQMVIVCAGNVYSCDGITLTHVAGTDFENPDFVALLNEQALYDGNAGRFCVSDPGALTTIDGLNYATAESEGDPLVRPYVFNQRVILFGTKSIEQWFNSGSGNPPFDRIEGSSFPIGLGAGFSVASNREKVYFLGHDRSVYRISSGQPQPVSDIALTNTFQDFTVVADAVGFCFKFQEQEFYLLNFPTQGETWVLHETTGAWFEMTSGILERAHPSTGYAYCYDKHLIEVGGSVLEWGKNTFTDNGEPIIRERTTANIDSALLGAPPGKRVFMSRLELIVQTGVGLVTGQGSDPKILMAFSIDGGRTWSNERPGSLGVLGDYSIKVEWNGLGSFYNAIFRFRVSDPVFTAFLALAADVEIGSW
jgi:hypothetical protein